ncbi:MAG: DUF1905 domain-containing protein [Bacteroidetes bacterium]|nr:MAG: DUF1905 domain-containing protein [Bacteroidota bacterium]
MLTHYTLKSKVWLYPGVAGWHFITLPKKQSTEIRANFGKLKKGWGSIPVQVTLGKTSWRTSIFPEKKSGAYLLPLKSEIRSKENISEGDTITYSIEIKL